MKKLQTDGESFMIKDAFAVARGEAKVVHSEAMARVREGRKNLEQFVRYKKMIGATTVLSICICVHWYL